MKEDAARNELSVIKLFGLTVLPGAIATALYLGLGTLARGIPSIALFCVLAMLTLMPFELWVVLSANKREYGRYGLRIAFPNQERTGWWRILLYALALFGIAGIASATVGALENRLTAGLSEKLYSALPGYFDWNRFDLMRQYPKGILVLTSIIYLLMNVFIGPITEEIYFRGYLTGRLERFGMLAPVLVTAAFSLYHWWLPFNNIFRFCAFGLAAWTAYRKKNIFITMVFHGLCNLFSTVSFIIALLG